METPTEEKPTAEKPKPTPESGLPVPEETPEETPAAALFEENDLGNMPDLETNVVQAWKKEAGPSGPHPPSSGKEPPSGEYFDAEVYDLDKNGKPQKNSKGKWKKKRGRKPKTEGQKAGKVFIPPEKTEKEQPPPPDQSGPSAPSPSFAAAVSIVATVDLAAGIISPEMHASEKEKEFLESAWDRYLNEKGVEDIPPGTALVMAMFAVYGLKLRHEEPRRKLLPFWEKLKFGTRQIFRRFTWKRREKPNTDKRDTGPEGYKEEGERWDRTP